MSAKIAPTSVDCPRWTLRRFTHSFVLKGTVHDISMRQVIQAYQSSRNRLFISDYDGTLTHLQSLPQLASPSPQVISVLEQLCADPRNTCVCVSAREKRFMDMWLGRYILNVKPAVYCDKFIIQLCRLHIALAAENGFFFRLPDDDHWRRYVLCDYITPPFVDVYSSQNT
jgi:trehalose-6-phosphatase